MTLLHVSYVNVLLPCAVFVFKCSLSGGLSANKLWIAAPWYFTLVVEDIAEV